jgi:Zn-dependent peptidase ImmA (M78 family)
LTRPAKAIPVDPFEIARSEGRRLKLIQDDFKNRFDGQLEYLKKPGKFLILLNNKYDQKTPVGEHHPRTRFSLGHELGHLYLEHHVSHLLRGGKPHPSRGEFEHKQMMELEADAFAASLLMPRDSFREELNVEEPSLDVVHGLSKTFHTSTVATLYRAVNLSDFPCAVVSVRDGKVAWTFSSQSLIDAGCYPPERAPLQSKKAIAAWTAFELGTEMQADAFGQVRSWFRTYDNENLLQVNVREEYLQLPWRTDLLVFLTISEQELADTQADENDSDDDD